MTLPTQDPRSVLKTVFGFDEYRPMQGEVIANVLEKRDTLAIMPTGGGKSLCYQIPALIFPGLTVVVSPLIALMKDQVEQLQALGVPALFLNSSLSQDEYQENMRRVQAGGARLLYVAPETLLTPRLFNLLDHLDLNCLTIDEAHCISEWGHDFRPEYRQLVSVRQRYPQAVCLALTATATPRVRADIKESLGFADSNEFITSFNRENLLIEVQPKLDPLAQTLQFLEQYPQQSGIIYCFSRKGVDELSASLERHGFTVRPYHAGLSEDERKRNQDLFINDDVQIIVATIAFGMGINKPDVRFVIHFDLPKSIEGYYQEIGRAGRDGLPSTCLLLYSYGDFQKFKYFIDQKDESERLVAYQHLNALTRYAESDVCRRVPLLAYFGEKYVTENCGNCDVCLNGRQAQVDITIPAQKFLSCAKRTGELFGAGHIADVLLGSENEKVLKFNHQALSTYGIGKELTRKQWMHIGRQLVQKGLLVQDDRYGSLKLTLRAMEALRNRETIQGVLQEEKPTLPQGQASAGTRDPILFDLLRTRRKELAAAARVPPYVIFSDRTLDEMATFYPQTGESLLQITGVGQVKADRYGPAFLEVILPYCQSRNLPEKHKPARSGLSPRQANLKGPAEGASNARHIQVGEGYNAGQSVQSLAESYGVQTVTILDHLYKFIQEGRSLRQGEDFLALSTLSSSQQAAALAAFTELGADRLRPVFERLHGDVNYDELKLVRLHHLSQKLG